MKYQLGERVRFRDATRFPIEALPEMEILEGLIIKGDVIRVEYLSGSSLSLGEWYKIDVNGRTYIALDNRIIERVLEPNDIEYYFKGEM